MFDNIICLQYVPPYQESDQNNNLPKLERTFMALSNAQI